MESGKYGCDVLLAGSMGDIAVTVRSSLESHGMTVMEMPFPQNTLRDECGYVRELRKDLSLYRPRIVIPIGDMTALSRFKSVTPDIACRIPVDSPAKIGMLGSKVQSSRLASAAGVRQPRFFDSACDVMTYPVVFKRDVSFGGTGVRMPSSRKALEQLIDHEHGGLYLIEEFVHGDNYSVDVFRAGPAFEFSCYRSVSNRGIKGSGPSTERETVDFPLLGEYARKMLDRIDYCGICGMDFIVDESGQPFFLECNPRFTGGLATQIAAGFDLPYMLARLCL